MSSKKLNKQPRKIMEGQYPNKFNSEEHHVVTFTDVYTGNNFWYGDYELFCEKNHIADLYDRNNWKYITDIIRICEGRIRQRN